MNDQYNPLEWLRSKAGSDAVTFACISGVYWICVCGKNNINRINEISQKCESCGRLKEYTLDNFTKLRADQEKTEEQQRRKNEWDRRNAEASHSIKPNKSDPSPEVSHFSPELRSSTIIIIVILALIFGVRECNKFKMQKKLSDAYRNHPSQWQR